MQSPCLKTFLFMSKYGKQWRTRTKYHMSSFSLPTHPPLKKRGWGDILCPCEFYRKISPYVSDEFTLNSSNVWFCKSYLMSEQIDPPTLSFSATSQASRLHAPCSPLCLRCHGSVLVFACSCEFLLVAVL